MTFTEPEGAHVGLYESDIASRGLKCDTYTSSLAENDRAICDGDAAHCGAISPQRRDEPKTQHHLESRHAGRRKGKAENFSRKFYTIARAHGVE